ncbi:hypothetical protein [Bifidobacterium vansinderenii]|nr:hypothetical protein [Bifidobacterium vansinderenii]
MIDPKHPLTRKYFPEMAISQTVEEEMKVVASWGVKDEAVQRATAEWLMGSKS